ncbi:MAG: malectin domain-containing carbohydrate-binding protein, partial [Owenweeksia sp.]
SNLSYASIEVNGTSYPSKELQNGVAEWNVPLTGDSLYILATARDGETEITLEKVYQLSSALNINLGANFYFHDPQANDLWRPDQRFEKGKTFGHSGGDIYRPRQVGIGVSRGIDNTDLDPVYQTQNQGLESYTLELKPGEYDLRLLWCRLDPKLESRFEVFINGKKLDEIDTSEMQEFSGMERNYPGIRTGKELEIQLKAIKGKTFLNGIQIVSSK